LERRFTEKQKKHREAMPEVMGNLRFPLDFYLSWISQNMFFRSIRHPREGGGPLKALKNMDSRLRGNDEKKQTNDRKEF
jgi:hypothetical protein